MKIVKELDHGNSDFKNIIENNNYFVDESLFIREVIKAQKQVILLPHPFRFGKTLNLSMLKYYFDINQPDNEKLFAHMKIYECEDKIKEKQEIRSGMETDNQRIVSTVSKVFFPKIIFKSG